MTADHLGSPRIITDNTGKVIARKDFNAFGDETNSTQRTTVLGYKPEEIRQDYTGYQKDDESGLEFAQARYYNGKHGRFTSVDPLTASANVKDPQTFNRYSYAMNSPYKFTDPLGLLSVSTGACGICQGDGGGSFSAKERDDEEVIETEQTAETPEPPPPPAAEQNAETLLADSEVTLDSVEVVSRIDEQRQKGDPPTKVITKGTLRDNQTAESTNSADAEVNIYDGIEYIPRGGTFYIKAVFSVTNGTFDNPDSNSNSPLAKISNGSSIDNTSEVTTISKDNGKTLVVYIGISVGGDGVGSRDFKSSTIISVFSYSSKIYNPNTNRVYERTINNTPFKISIVKRAPPVSPCTYKKC